MKGISDGHRNVVNAGNGFGVWRLAFGVWRSAFGVWRLFGVRRESSDFVPKGPKDSAWGFNPRLPTQETPALTRRFVLVLVVVLVLESCRAG